MRLGLSLFSVALLGAVAFLASPSASLPEAETFSIDPVHSTVIFRINHMGVSNVYGRFNGISGEFTVNSGGAGSVDVTIDAASVDTGNAKRDAHLKSPAFFSVEEFPQITFKSSALKHVDGNQYEAKGTLTLRGVSKDVTIQVEQVGAKDLGKMGYRMGFEGTLTIHRSDFGMKYMVDGGALGDEVKLILSVEGQRK
jgi:polyisoprenoid-binding protein YceI